MIYLIYYINEVIKLRICPFCEASIPRTDETVRHQKLGFEYHENFPATHQNYDFIFISVKCPNCSKKHYLIDGQGNPFGAVDNMSIYPKSKAKQFPEFIPASLRQDYEEAYSILDLSPKASATLSRRCLQGMIRDFHGIKGNSLYHEISQLEEIIPASQYKVLHSLRKLGNIGAHFEKDVNLIVKIEANEAEKLIKLIEFLFEKWYIEQKETEDLFDIINETSAQKNKARKDKSN